VTIVWYPLALDDLEAIQGFLARENPGRAMVVVQRIVATTDLLMAHPQLGRPGRVRDTRELVVPRTPYIVAYREREGSIEILRVIHGAQRWPPL
jgi:plasmid stabilization system protein ParE